ncbi:SUKH-3 domain-containing protein [Streptomyces sp. NPDC086787]|uniref:SUKH-3 domain-containing protein n=1 Tax=Streptomyces sp. NPDC086787 TaxID=3365759 RepID=UPI0037F4EEE7
MDPQFLRDDFAHWQADWRPGWPEDVLVDKAWVDAAATYLRGTGVIEETLRAAGWRPGRHVGIDHWRKTLERTGLVRKHDAAEAFLAKFGGLKRPDQRPRDHLRQDPLQLRPGQADRRGRPLRRLESHHRARHFPPRRTR